MSEWEINSDEDNEDDDRASSVASAPSIDDTSKDITTETKSDVTHHFPAL